MNGLKTKHGTVINFNGVSKLDKCYFPFPTVKKLVQWVQHKRSGTGSAR